MLQIKLVFDSINGHSTISEVYDMKSILDFVRRFKKKPKKERKKKKLRIIIIQNISIENKFFLFIWWK